MSDPTPRPDAAAPAAAEHPAPGQPASTHTDRRPWRRARRIIGWCTAAGIGLLAAFSLAPDLFAGLSDNLRLSLRYPFAQAIAVRSGLVLLLTLVGLVIAATALTRVLRREGGRRTGALALILLLVAGAHSIVLWDRGLHTTEITGAPAAAGQAWDGELTVLTFNTYAGRASMVELAIVIRQSAPDVVVLPETHAGETAELLTLLTQDGFVFTSFTAEADSPPAAGDSAGAGADASPTPTASPGSRTNPTTPAVGFDGEPGTTSVLLNVVIGEYEQVSAPEGLGHGAVLLQPVGDPLLDGHQRPTILGVHTISPLKGAMDLWAQSVSRVVAQCAQPTTGLIVAGDLNATLDHAPMRDLGGCTDAALDAGGAGLSTWPTSTRTALLGSAIDHVLVDAATWSATGVDVIDISGSDHRALVVTLEPR